MSSHVPSATGLLLLASGLVVAPCTAGTPRGVAVPPGRSVTDKVAAAPAPSSGHAGDGYVFIPGATWYVEMRRGRTFSIGKLDAAGNFLPDPRWVNLPRNRGLSGLPPTFPLNSSTSIGERVYEYR